MIAPKTYPPVGRCVYCRSTDGPLSREHIIARGLGGRLVLPEASCETCREITSKIERTCLRAILGNVRVHLAYPTGHPKERPQELRLEAIVAGKVEVQYRPVNEHPAAIFLFAFDDARILRGHHAEFGEFIASPWIRYVNVDPERERRLGVDGMRVGFHPAPFARMLAKIAHCYAVAELGLDGLNPLLPDLIVVVVGTPLPASSP
jgi:hypothetical protein